MNSDLASTFIKARKAQLLWYQKSLNERLEVMKNFRHQLAVEMDNVVSTICHESSKTKIDALGGDILVTLEALRYYIKNATNILKRERIPSRSLLYLQGTSYTEPYPYGVVLVIGPWNYPFQLCAIPAISALIAGNAVILKPSELCPETALWIQKLLYKAGLPEDLFQVCIGDGEIAKNLIRLNPDKIFVTGSTATGMSVMELASKSLIPLSLELGGKDAMIVREDAPLERTVSGALFGSFSNAGQVCVSAKRIFVHANIFEQFKKKFLEGIATLNIGTDPYCDFGPMARIQEVQTIQKQVKDALERGALQLTPSEVHDRLMKPIVLTNVSAESLILNEETFGPVVVLEPYSDEETLIKNINSSRFGLAASIWSQNIEAAQHLAAQLIVGFVHINDIIKGIGNPALPFGGEKHSGFGRYHGKEGLWTFSRARVVSVETSQRKREFHWFPSAEKTFNMLKKVIQFRHQKGGLVKKFFLLFLVFLCCSESQGQFFLKQSTPTPEPLKAHLKVTVTNLHAKGGQLAFAIFNNTEAFPSKKELAIQKGFLKIEPGATEIQVEFKDLEAGTYAASFYQDLNNNGKLDKNFLGIPREPIGHTMDPPILLGPPRFHEARIKVNLGDQKVLVKLVH